jgi:hypothetical protein
MRLFLRRGHGQTVEHLFGLGKRLPAKIEEICISTCEQVCYFDDMECVSGERLAAALAMRRRPELWDTNPRLAERIEMRIKDTQRAHRQAHGGNAEAMRCLSEQHPDVARR